MSFRLVQTADKEPNLCAACGHGDTGSPFVESTKPLSIRNIDRRYRSRLAGDPNLGRLYIHVSCLKLMNEAAGIIEREDEEQGALWQHMFEVEKRKLENLKARVKDLGVNLDEWDGLLPWPRIPGSILQYRSQFGPVDQTVEEDEL